MNTDADPLGAQLTRAWIEIECPVTNAKAAYAVTTLTVMTEGACRTFHRVKLATGDIVAHSLSELTAILREHFSDLPLHWAMRFEIDEQAARAA